ncbi:unnamed protein product [Callosobruchus maculatus]|uniref:Uncharacterized protein n=1 Tax=Callosobruchus maculatus TaxID=64391 RepID=A0A653D0D9_CALMS|nr:unnamed protein product [Callosobruchus maculatus]
MSCENGGTRGDILCRGDTAGQGRIKFEQGKDFDGSIGPSSSPKVIFSIPEFGNESPCSVIAEAVIGLKRRRRRKWQRKEEKEKGLQTKSSIRSRSSLTKVLQHLISMKLNANYPTFICCVLGYMRGSPNGQTSISIA